MPVAAEDRQPTAPDRSGPRGRPDAALERAGITPEIACDVGHVTRAAAEQHAETRSRDVELRRLLLNVVLELERGEPRSRQLDLGEVSRAHALGVHADNVVERREILPCEGQIQFRKLRVGEGRLDVQDKLPRRVEQLQLRDRACERRLFDPAFALAAAFDDIVGADDAFTRAVPRVDELAVGQQRTDRDNRVRPQSRSHDRRLGDADVVALGEPRQVVVERFGDGLLDGDWLRILGLRRGVPRTGRDHDRGKQGTPTRSSHDTLGAHARAHARRPDTAARLENVLPERTGVTREREAPWNGMGRA